MNILHNAGQLAFRLLSEESEHHFFVRIASQNDCLWVCDLPRFTQNTEQMEKMLLLHGMVCLLDSDTKLWHIDWTAVQYQRILGDLPSALPNLPQNEELHPAYALCRLLLYAKQVDNQPLPIVRNVWKLSEERPSVLLRAIPRLHAQCAQLQRLHKPLPYSAGRILATWLYEQEAQQ